MPAAKRIRPQTHVVLVDTNILWDEDKKNAVRPDFDKFWLKALELVPMELHVPSVVYAELHFQQTTSGIKAGSTIRKLMGDLGGMTQADYSAKLEDSIIRIQVRLKLTGFATL